MFLARINRECISLFCRKIDYACSQLVDLQIFAAPRITLKPLVPTFPCFASLVLSLMEKVSRNFVPFLGEWTYNNFFFFFSILFVYLQPHVDFGLKILGGDIMSIPGLYRFVQVLH